MMLCLFPENETNIFFICMPLHNSLPDLAIHINSSFWWIIFKGLCYFLEQNVILFLEQPKLVIKSFFCEDEYILNRYLIKEKNQQYYALLSRSFFHKIFKSRNSHFICHLCLLATKFSFRFNTFFLMES